MLLALVFSACLGGSSSRWSTVAAPHDRILFTLGPWLSCADLKGWLVDVWFCGHRVISIYPGFFGLCISRVLPPHTRKASGTKWHLLDKWSFSIGNGSNTIKYQSSPLGASEGAACHRTRSSRLNPNNSSNHWVSEQAPIAASRKTDWMKMANVFLKIFRGHVGACYPWGWHARSNTTSQVLSCSAKFQWRCTWHAGLWADSVKTIFLWGKGLFGTLCGHHFLSFSTYGHWLLCFYTPAK